MDKAFAGIGLLTPRGNVHLPPPLHGRQLHNPFSFIDGTFGALEIGTTIGTFLFGILTLQTFNYYRQFPQDSRLLKTTGTLADKGQVFRTRPHGLLSACIWRKLDWYKTYWTTVTSYGRPPYTFMMEPPRSLILTVLFSTGIDALVQVFFANRIRVLSGRRHVFFLCIVLAAAGFTSGMAIIIIIWTSNEGLSIIESKTVRWIGIAAITLVPLGDVLIALSMCYYLWNMRKSGSQFRRNYSGQQVRHNIPDIKAVHVFSSVAAVMELVLQFLTRTDLSFTALSLIQAKSKNIPGDWIQNTD
ncbi:hypothetical protein FB451DRAFT_1471954 [Mycena latifolia]|nr:hypothetical protein FB451DRAFT_1471954 [Mycena latifolia]